jgi:hypothetical protein
MIQLNLRAAPLKAPEYISLCDGNEHKENHHVGFDNNGQQALSTHSSRQNIEYNLCTF